MREQSEEEGNKLLMAIEGMLKFNTVVDAKGVREKIECNLSIDI